MNPQIIASSVSRPVRETVYGERVSAQVFGVFEHACSLVTSNGRVVALVLAAVGNGPLNVVLEAEPGGFTQLRLGTPAELQGDRLHIDPLTINLEHATTWEPCPNWAELRTGKETLIQNLSFVRELALSQGPPNTLLSLIDEPFAFDHLNRPHSTFEKIVSLAREGATSLMLGWDGTEQLHAAGARLAGLGGGLTPAGDDFLMGVMLWAWLAHPTPDRLCRLLAEAAVPRTTTLSAAWLHAAARGECSADWHALLHTLSQGDTAAMSQAVQDVLAHGATSGADTLAGFLWLESNKKTPQKRQTSEESPPNLRSKDYELSDCKAINIFSAESGNSVKRIPKAS